jgi:hypothetical protein
MSILEPFLKYRQSLEFPIVVHGTGSESNEEEFLKEATKIRKKEVLPK